MIVIKPEVINDSKLIYTNVPETDAPAWSNATAYASGASVIYNHRIYVSLASTTGQNPESFPLVWQDTGATNRYRVFDKIIGNTTSNPGTMVYTIRPGTIISGVSFFNLNAASVRVEMVDPTAGTVYDTTILLIDLSTITSYYTYFFNAVAERKRELTLVNLPNYPLADITITISNGIENAECGEIVIGTQRVLGYTNYGTSIGIRDYSRKETDEFGNTSIVERRFSKIADYDVSFKNTDLASIQRFLASIRATPVVWIGNASLEETIVYGYYKNFQIVISDLTFSDSSIEVEGLT